jgi:hypothetical protein
MFGSAASLRSDVLTPPSELRRFRWNAAGGTRSAFQIASAADDRHER